MPYDRRATLSRLAKVYDRLDDRLRAFVLAQPVFFVATAPDRTASAEGHVNLSPKGVPGSFAVLDDLTVAYVDLTGSGIETHAHLRQNGRITLMFCAFSGSPKIVRIYGRGDVVLPDEPDFAGLAAQLPASGEPGVRAVIRVRATRIADACGYAVPRMAYEGERTLLRQSAERRGPAGLATYRATRNAVSIDGLPGLVDRPASAPPAAAPPG